LTARGIVLGNSHDVARERRVDAEGKPRKDAVTLQISPELHVVEKGVRGSGFLQQDRVSLVLCPGLPVGGVRAELLDRVDEGLVKEGLPVVGDAGAPDGVVGKDGCAVVVVCPTMSATFAWKETRNKERRENQ